MDSNEKYMMHNNSKPNNKALLFEMGITKYLRIFRPKTIRKKTKRMKANPLTRVEEPHRGFKPLNRKEKR